VEHDYGWGPVKTIADSDLDHKGDTSSSTAHRGIMRDVESKVAELDRLLSSAMAADAAAAAGVAQSAARRPPTSVDLVEVGDTIAVFQNGAVRFSTAAPRRRKEWSDQSGQSGSQADASRTMQAAEGEVDLPALQWVQGLHSFVENFQAEADAAADAAEPESESGGQPEYYRGCHVGEMSEALEVLTAWKAELGATDGK
jgi:hypothetical protein